MKEKMMTMKNTKAQLFKAGRENYHQTLLLREKLDHMEVINLSLVNSLKWILSHVPTIDIGYEDVDDSETSPPEKEKRDMEVQ